MKKVISLLLIAALVAGFTSCGETAPDVPDDVSSEATDTTVPEKEMFYDGLPDVTFEGRTYTILNANQYTLHINIPGDSLNGEVVNDALYERGLDVGQRFDAEIKYVNISPTSNGITAFRNSVLAGDSDYQLCMSPIKGGALGTLATEGLLANLCDMPSLSLDKPWWSRLMYDNLRMNDRMFYTSGDISTSMYYMAACIYLNKKLLADYGDTTDYYQMVRDGKWTIDVLTALAKDKDEDLNGDGVMHTNDDFFGFVHQPNETTISMMLVGCGLKLSENEKDKITIDLGSERAYEVYDKVSALKRIVKFDDQDDTIKKAFFNDRALSMLHLVDSTTMLRGMESDFSVLPMPKFDEAQEEYYSLCNPWSDAFIGVPVNADGEFVGVITEALAKYSYLNIRSKALELNLKQKGLRDVESIEMLNIIYDGAYLDFNSCYVFGGLMTKVAAAIMNDQPVASEIASAMPGAEGEAEELAAVFLKD